jgi:mannose-1-phosphate guanylyltransferase
LHGSAKSSAIDEKLQIVVLAGGIGSRFWPASTPRRPKQLLPLASERPLIVDTVSRAESLVPPERLHILAGEHLAAPFRSALDLPESSYMLEPAAKGTAPVLAWAAHNLARIHPESVMVSLHSDHRIEPLGGFIQVVRAAAELADRDGLLLTVGVVPTRPETGYGYIEPGSELEAAEGLRAFEVDSFTEKPDAATASTYMNAGYFWNTGIFVWRVDRFLEEVREHAPEIGDLLHLLDDGRPDEFFARVPSITVDVAIMERSMRVATVAATFEWDDVGNWEALARTHTPDENGNVRVGPGAIVGGGGNIVYGEGAPVVLYGVDDLVVVRTDEATLVIRRELAPDLKSLLDGLPADVTNLEGDR